MEVTALSGETVTEEALKTIGADCFFRANKRKIVGFIRGFISSGQHESLMPNFPLASSEPLGAAKLIYC